MENYYQIIKLKENIYRIISKENVFIDLFVGKEKALLWDTGYGYGNLKKVIRDITDLPLIVVNSHGHPDHACGNYQFDEDIYIHKNDFELCKKFNSKEARVKNVENAKNSFDFSIREYGNALPYKFDEENYINQGYGNIKFISEGDVFDLGGITLEVIEATGHTKGSIVLLYKEEGWLYVADAMGPFIWLFAEEADTLENYKKTLYKIKEIDFNKMILGHLPEMQEKEMIDDLIYCAENVNYDNGFKFENPIIESNDARICFGRGESMEQIGQPGVMAIVISKEKL